MNTYWLLIIICQLAVLLPAFGQTSVRGAIQGAVTDMTRAAVPGVTVTVVHQDTNERFTGQTDDRGSYLLGSLPIGTYTLYAEAAGFAAIEVKEVRISVGQTVVQNLELKVQSSAEKLEVVERAEILQASSPNQSVALGYEQMEHSPAPGRNYVSFVLNAPGMAPASGSSTGRSPAGTWNVANDSGFVFAGMRSRNNSVSIDGTDNRDETTGAIRVAVPLEMIQELRIAGTTVSADFGGAAGGQVNIVTRSGSNDWHGHGEFMWMHEAFNARNPEFAIAARPRKRRYQPGGSGSGPIRRDRTFFSFAAEGVYEDCEEWSDTPASFAALANGLGGSSLPLPNLTTGLFRASEGDQQYSAKLQHALSQNHSLTARYAYSWGKVNRGVQGVDNFSDFSARGTSVVKDHSFVPSLTSVLSSRAVNQLVVQIASRATDITPNSRTPQFEIPGLLTFGQGYRMDQSRSERHVQATDSVSVALGRHFLSLGADVHYVSLDNRQANRFAGIWLFPDVAAFAAARPDEIIQAFGRIATAPRTTPVGFWLNDRWQVRRGLTLEAGLRYDRQWTPSPIPASNLNFAPRLGLAWNPSSRVVFRLGTGLFFDRYPLAYLNDAIQKDGVNAWEMYRFLNADPVRARYLPSRQFSATYAAKITAGAEVKLNADTTLAAEYSFLRGLNLPRMRNIASPAAGPEFLLEQTARSTYNGIILTLNRRMTHEFGYTLSYSAGRTNDDGSDYDEQPSNSGNIAQDWSRSRQHQAHRITATALLEAPFWEHLHVVPMFSYGSGRPWNVVLPSDVNRTTAYPLTARPAGVGRNPVIGSANASLDARVFKEFQMEERRAKLQIGVEGYNLLNKTNPIRLNPFLGSNYLNPVEFGPARQLQMFGHFEF